MPVTLSCPLRRLTVVLVKLTVKLTFRRLVGARWVKVLFLCILIGPSMWTVCSAPCRTCRFVCRTFVMNGVVELLRTGILGLLTLTSVPRMLALVKVVTMRLMADMAVLPVFRSSAYRCEGRIRL